jgi:hypothetical protein
MRQKVELKKQGEARDGLTEKEMLLYISAYVHSVVVCYLRITIFCV